MTLKTQIILDRIAAKSKAAGGGCRIWTGATTQGFPVMEHNRHRIIVQRFLWQLFHGEVPPPDLTVRTTCGNKLCVSTGHLCLKTRKEIFWQPDEEVLSKILHRTIPDDKGCFIYAGHNVLGYGSMHYRGKLEYVRRVVWMIHNGPIPEGQEVIAKCHQRSCINIAHLYLGTHMDAIRERDLHSAEIGKVFRARARKLSDEQVLEIWHRLQACEGYAAIAQSYGVSAGCIQAIAQGRTFSYLTGALSQKGK